MFETFANVPAYPLVFPLFYGAAAIFVLAMARHLRVFAAAHQSGAFPLSEAPRRVWAVVEYMVVHGGPPLAQDDDRKPTHPRRSLKVTSRPRARGYELLQCNSHCRHVPRRSSCVSKVKSR